MRQESISLPDDARIAIVRLSALGDVTLMLPTIHSILQRYPKAKITWIIGRSAYALLAGLPGVEFLVIDKPSSVGDYWRFRRQLDDREFDVLLAMQASLRANLLYPFIRAKRKIGYDSRRAKDGQRLFTNESIPFSPEHLLDSFFAFAKVIGVTEKLLRWEIPLDGTTQNWAASLLAKLPRPLLVVNPAASKPERTWRGERYIEVIRAAQQRWHAHVILTGGNSDFEKTIGATVQAAIGDNITNLIGQTSPKQLAALLKQSTCLLAPDTGPAHIATAMGTPVVSLFAVAPPQLSAPYLYQDLVVNRFPEAVRNFLKQDPATIAWGTRVHDPAAMDLISADDVMAKLSLVFEQQFPPTAKNPNV